MGNAAADVTAAEPAAFQAGYADYALFLQQIGEVEHAGCLLLTSRELPVDVARLERSGACHRDLELDPAHGGRALCGPRGDVAHDGPQFGIL